MGDPASDLLARRLRLFAHSELRGYCPLYERIALALADDPDRVARLAPLGEAGRVPGLVLAAVHDATLAEPDLELAAIYGGAPGDPWPPFAALLDERFDELAAVVTSRTLQTNEVGRCAALVPALAVVAGALGSPLALVEVGPSAGLNLLLDRYRYDYRLADGTPWATWGPAGSPVALACQVVGAGRPPLPGGPLDLASRLGIDAAPVDVADPAATRWLEACLWPGVPQRAERLRAALAVARPAPPALVAGDMLELLGPTLDALPDGVVPCVSATWALAYLSRDGRLALHDALAERGRGRDLALVAAEYPHVTPWVPVPDRPAAVEAGRGATLVTLTTWRGGREEARPLAWVQAHGQWLDWLG